MPHHPSMKMVPLSFSSWRLHFPGVPAALALLKPRLGVGRLGFIGKGQASMQREEMVENAVIPQCHSLSQPCHLA